MYSLSLPWHLTTFQKQAWLFVLSTLHEPVCSAAFPSSYSALCFCWRSQSSQLGSLAVGLAVGSVPSRVTLMCNLYLQVEAQGCWQATLRGDGASSFQEGDS